MTDKDLAKKVAEKLGWRTYTWQEQVYAPEIKGFVVVDFEDWKLFGLMVEKAESMGWRVEWDTIMFRFHNNRSEEQPDFECTEDYSTKEHGHIKACALAFIEIN